MISLRTLTGTLIGLMMLMSACGPSAAPLPTVASLADDTITNSDTPTPATSDRRPTLPPTFTPTAPPTSTSAPTAITATTEATQRIIPTSVLGNPQDAPQNYPVVLSATGDEFNLNLNPPPYIGYTLADGVYTLTLQYIGRDEEVLTLYTIIRDGTAAGNYTPGPCSNVGNSIQPEDMMCLSVTYTNQGLIAVQRSANVRLSLTTLEPLTLEASVPMNLTLMPNATGFDTTRPASVTLSVNGQGRTS